MTYFEQVGVAADRRGLVLEQDGESVERKEATIELFMTQTIDGELVVIVKK